MFTVLDVPNGANMHPDLGVFACDECFEKFIAWNWPPVKKERCPECDGTDFEKEICGNINIQSHVALVCQDCGQEL